MTIARSAGVFLGTDETTGITITNTSTTTSSEIDVLGGDTSEGRLRLYLKYTGTAAAGTIDVTIYPARLTTKSYAAQQPLVASPIPINGTESIFLGDFPVSRFMLVSVKNNAVGASITNVTVGYELFKVT
jgi:hypothetical protein